MPYDSPEYMPARQVWERYGVTQMTLHRWVNDAPMCFPAPAYLGRFRYWKISDLEAWERSRPRGRTRETAVAGKAAADA